MIRVGLITAGKLAALALFCAIAATLVVYLMFRNKTPQPESTTPKLQGRVVAAFNNTRYAHEVDGRVRFVLTAGVDRTYEDGTHELEQVRLESRGSAGDRNDVISADRAKVSDPADLNRLDAEFISNVVLQTSDGLTVKTGYLHYGHTDGVVDTKELVTFERGDLSGRTTGARIETAEERVHLISDVDLTIKPRSGNDGPRASQPGSEGGGSVGKKAEETQEEKAARKARKRERKRAARAGRKANRTGGSVREASKKLAAKPTRIQSQTALLEKKEGRVTFTGRVIVTQGADSMRAERMTGLIGHGTRISQIEARGQAELKQAKRFAISASDMDFFFGDNQELSRALATGEVHATSLDTGPVREARAATVEAIFV
ncbi:MAG TPA: LPS export ABC transporter periplasmic protein LptC, partial [Blastocatellia bacterium]|nr:LPS export ABC transporter periplasmic protein LptC [Blastocatellia bacterium]